MKAYHTVGSYDSPYQKCINFDLTE